MCIQVLIVLQQLNIICSLMQTDHINKGIQAAVLS